MIKATYQKIYNTSAKTPYLLNTFAKDDNGDIGEDLWPKEKYLRLLIKMPAAVKASIVILEGDWTLGSNYMTTINPTDSVIGDKENLEFNVA